MAAVRLNKSQKGNGEGARMKPAMRWSTGLIFSLVPVLFISGGCTSNHDHMHAHKITKSSETIVLTLSEKRVSLGLDQTAREAHQAVMRDHLKAIHEIVAALAVEEFERAQDLTETRLGFAKHREAMRQLNPEDFPPAYHDLAMVHHQTAEELAKVIPSKNLKQILPHLERTLNACVECHEHYKR